MDSIREASLDELEQLLIVSQSQQRALNDDLEQFVATHLDHFAALYQATDDDSQELHQTLAPYKASFPILGTLETLGAQVAVHNKQHERQKASSEADKALARSESGLASAATHIQTGEYTLAFSLLAELKSSLESHGQDILDPETITLLFDRTSEQQSFLFRQVNSTWNEGLSIPVPARICVKLSDVLNQAVTVLQMMGTLEAKCKSLSQLICTQLILPLLVDHQAVTFDSQNVSHAIAPGLAGVSTLVKLIFDTMPQNVLTHLRVHFPPELTHTIRHTYLPGALPAQIQATARIEVITSALRDLHALLKDLGCHGHQEIPEIVSEIPRLWFQNRRSVVLDQCRRLVLSWTGATEIVEQNEHVTESSLLAPVAPQSASNDADDDDWGATDWDFDVPDTQKTADSDHETDAWGLDIDDDDDDTKQAAQPTTPPTETTVRLSSRYAISTIPKQLLRLMEECRSDAQALQHSTLLATQAPALAALDSDILDLYKALVPDMMTRTGYPRMTIYNDGIYLASHCAAALRASSFGERYYAMELCDKREQIAQIMARAQEFRHVAVPDVRETCARVVEDTLDLLRRIAERYEPQMSRTTLLTAIGTLADFAITCFVDAVQRMTDISEAESMELAKLGDCLSRLEDLFTSDTEQEQVLAAMWCPHWFKFRLLLDILEAKLDYILQLWDDGDLIDFKPREIESLIRALFSDSPKRRSAIQKITAVS